MSVTYKRLFTMITEEQAESRFQAVMCDLFADAFLLWGKSNGMVSPRTAIIEAAGFKGHILLTAAMDIWMAYEEACILRKKNPYPEIGFATVLREYGWKRPERGDA